jgi:hypothetical protein
LGWEDGVLVGEGGRFCNLLDWHDARVWGRETGGGQCFGYPKIRYGKPGSKICRDSLRHYFKKSGCMASDRGNRATLREADNDRNRIRVYSDKHFEREIQTSRWKVGKR